MLTNEDIIEIKAQIAKRFDKTPAHQAAEACEQLGFTSDDLDELLNYDDTSSELSQQLSITIDALEILETEDVDEA